MPSISPTTFPHRLTTPSPSGIPTSAPTHSADSIWLDQLGNFLVHTASDAYAAPEAILFPHVSVSSLGTEGAPTTVRGTCAEWTAFWSANAPVGVADLRLTRSRVFFASQTEVGGVIPSFSCDDEIVVDAIIGALVQGAIFDSGVIRCGSTRSKWRVKVCSDGRRAVCSTSSDGDECKLSADPCDDDLAMAAAPLSQAAWLAPCAAPARLRRSEYDISSGGINALSIGFSKQGLAQPPLVEIAVEGELVPDVQREWLSVNMHVNLTAANKRGSSAFCAATPTQEGASESSPLFASTMDFIREASSSLTPIVPPPPGVFKTVVEVVVRDLEPAMNYTLSCAAVSKDGEVTDLSMLRQIDLTTMCCRQVLVDVQIRGFYAGSHWPAAIAVSLSHQPKIPLEVDLQFRSLNDSDALSALPVSVPGRLVFEPNMGALDVRYAAIDVSQMSILAMPMWFEVFLSLSGNTKGDFEWIVAGAPNITVLPRSALPIAPELQSAAFSSDGTSIRVSLSTVTNRAQLPPAFPCEHLMDFTGADEASCQWLDDKDVMVVPQGRVRVLPGEDMILVPRNPLTARCLDRDEMQCGLYPTYQVSHGTRIIAPENLVAPTVSISGAATVGLCDDIVMDFSGSTGSGGRPWQSVALTSVTDVPELNDLLDSNHFKAVLALTLSVRIPAGILAAGTEHAFTVQMCNFLGSCSARVHRVIIMLSDETPILRVLGADVRKVSVSQALSIQSVAHISTCSGEATSHGFVYTWGVHDARTNVELTHLKSSSKMPSKFLLPAYALLPDMMYRLTVLATHRTSLSAVFTQVTIYTVPLPLVAIIAGNAHQSLTRSTETIVLDASMSHDGDYPWQSWDESGLSFEWDCELLVVKLADGNLFEPMTGAFDEGCGVKVKLAERTRPMVSAHFREWSYGTLSRITVVVSHAPSGRMASASVVLEAQPELAPVVTVVRSVPDVTTNNRINPASKLSITSMVQYWSQHAADTGMCEWKITPALPASTLLSGLRTPRTTQLPALPTLNQSSTVPLNLVLDKNSLVPGLAFTFTVECGMSSGLTASSLITVAVNAGPRPGSFAVFPPNGTEFSTSFVFMAMQWEDVDLPLLYKFGFLVDGDESSYMPVQQRIERVETTTQLPAGREHLDHVIAAQAGISDSLGAVTQAQQKVQVLEMLAKSTGSSVGLSSSEERSSALLAIAESVTSLETELPDLMQAQQIMSAVSAALNAVNCSLPLGVNCSVLNRLPCAATSHTCGSCVHSSFVGVAGDSNTKCLPPLTSATTGAPTDDGESSSMEQLTETQLREEIQSASTSLDADIVHAISAIAAPKQCSLDCSGHGSCVYRYTGKAPTYAPAQPKTCRLSDAMCEAVCECDPGYEGTLCGLSSHELQVRRRTRDVLIERLVNDTRFADPELDVFRLQTATALGLAHMKDELSSKALLMLRDLAQLQVHMAVEKKFAFTDAADAFKLYDLLMKAEVPRIELRNGPAPGAGNGESSGMVGFPRRLSADNSTPEANGMRTAQEKVQQSKTVMDALGLLGMAESLPDEFRFLSSIQDMSRVATVAFAPPAADEDRDRDDTHDDAGAQVSHFVPLTMLEMLANVDDGIDITFPAVSLTGRAARQVTKMALAQFDARLYGEEVQSDFNSHPMRLQYQTRASLCPDPIDDQVDDEAYQTSLGNNKLNFTLNHRAAMQFPSAPFNYTVVQCPTNGKSITQTVDCRSADGRSTYPLTVPCWGRDHYRGSGLLNVTCPNITTVSVCSVNEDEVGTDVGAAHISSCRAVHFETYRTLCECDLACPSLATREHRRLQNSGARQNMNPDTTIETDRVGIVEVVAMTEHIVDDFVGIVVSMDQLAHVNTWVDASIVIIFYASVLIVTVVMLVIGEMFSFGGNGKHGKKVSPLIKSRDSKTGMFQKDERTGKKVNPKKEKHKEEKIKGKQEEDMERFVDSLFPGALGGESGSVRLRRELMQTELFSLMVAGKSQTERFSTALYFVSTNCLSAFIIAFLYAIQYPTDDGSCGAHFTSMDCLREKSVFDRDESKCFWFEAIDPGDHLEIGHCEWRDVDVSLRSLVAILIITVVVTGPLYGMLNYCFDFILMAPTMKQVDEEKSTLINMKRFIVNTAGVMRRSIMSLASTLSFRARGMGGLNGHSEVEPSSGSSRRHGLHLSTPRGRGDSYDDEESLTSTTPPDSRSPQPSLIPSLETKSTQSPNNSFRKNQLGQHIKPRVRDVDELVRTEFLDRTIAMPREYHVSLRVAAQATVEKAGHGGGVLKRDMEKAETVLTNRRLTFIAESQNMAMGHNTEETAPPQGVLERMASVREQVQRSMSIAMGAVNVTLTDGIKRSHVHVDYREEFLSLVSKLEVELNVHRHKLTTKECGIFDCQWGLANVPNLDKDEELQASWKIRDRDFILKKIAYSVTLANHTLEDIVCMADHHQGAEIIRLYTEDCLGASTNHARTFKSKYTDEFRKHYAITLEVKLCTAAFLVLLNIFFVAACVIFGARRGPGWQRTWLLSCLLKTVLDLLFKRIVQGFVVGFAVPNLINDDLVYVQRKLYKAGMRLLDPKKRFKLDKFSATDYCHASNILARRLPHLIESQLVLMHRDRIPERLVQRRHRMDSVRNSMIAPSLKSRAAVGVDRRKSRLTQWMTSVSVSTTLLVTQVCLTFGSLHSDYQKLFIHVLPSTLLVTVGYLLSLASESPIAAALIALAFVVVIGMLTYWWAKNTFFDDHFIKIKRRARALKREFARERSHKSGSITGAGPDSKLRETTSNFSSSDESYSSNSDEMEDNAKDGLRATTQTPVKEHRTGQTSSAPAPVALGDASEIAKTCEPRELRTPHEDANEGLGFGLASVSSSMTNADPTAATIRARADLNDAVRQNDLAHQKNRQRELLARRLKERRKVNSQTEAMLVGVRDDEVRPASPPAGEVGTSENTHVMAPRRFSRNPSVAHVLAHDLRIAPRHADWETSMNQRRLSRRESRSAAVGTGTENTENKKGIPPAGTERRRAASLIRRGFEADRTHKVTLETRRAKAAAALEMRLRARYAASSDSDQSSDEKAEVTAIIGAFLGSDSDASISAESDTGTGTGIDSREGNENDNDDDRASSEDEDDSAADANGSVNMHGGGGGGQSSVKKKRKNRKTLLGARSKGRPKPRGHKTMKVTSQSKKKMLAKKTATKKTTKKGLGDTKPSKGISDMASIRASIRVAVQALNSKPVRNVAKKTSAVPFTGPRRRSVLGSVEIMPAIDDSKQTFVAPRLSIARGPHTPGLQQTGMTKAMLKNAERIMSCLGVEDGPVTEEDGGGVDHVDISDDDDGGKPKNVLFDADSSEGTASSSDQDVLE